MAQFGKNFFKIQQTKNPDKKSGFSASIPCTKSSFSGLVQGKPLKY